MDERYLYAAGGVVVGIGVGIGATYMWFQKQFDKEVAEAVAQEKAAVQTIYAIRNQEDVPTPEELAEERGVLVEEVEILIREVDYSGEQEEKDAVDAELAEVTRNVFTNYANTSTWDADKEEADRDPSVPYVISHDEFFENEPDHIQAQLTWWSEDGVLADSEDKPVDESIVGPDNLEKFGHGSRDPNLVYVRNEAMDIDFEIAYAEGKYSEQVMGFLKHEQPTIRRFRLDDE